MVVAGAAASNSVAASVPPPPLLLLLLLVVAAAPAAVVAQADSGRLEACGHHWQPLLLQPLLPMVAATAAATRARATPTCPAPSRQHATAPQASSRLLAPARTARRWLLHYLATTSSRHRPAHSQLQTLLQQRSGSSRRSGACSSSSLPLRSGGHRLPRQLPLRLLLPGAQRRAQRKGTAPCSLEGHCPVRHSRQQRHSLAMAPAARQTLTWPKLAAMMPPPQMSPVSLHLHLLLR
jgi:hypothetical protein